MTHLLFRLGAMAAMLAGLLRMGASLLSYTDPTPARELFYLTIDLCTLFGVITIYLYQYVELGRIGLLGFIAAVAGTAIIVGPDGHISSISMYSVGSALLLVGLAVIAVVGWSLARVPRYALASWLLSAALGIGSTFPGAPSTLVVVAGLLFGLGFVVAGAKIWSNPTLS